MPETNMSRASKNTRWDMLHVKGRQTVSSLERMKILCELGCLERCLEEVDSPGDWGKDTAY